MPTLGRQRGPLKPNHDILRLSKGDAQPCYQEARAHNQKWTKHLLRCPLRCHLCWQSTQSIARRVRSGLPNTFQREPSDRYRDKLVVSDKSRVRNSHLLFRLNSYFPVHFGELRGLKQTSERGGGSTEDNTKCRDLR